MELGFEPQSVWLHSSALNEGQIVNEESRKFICWLMHQSPYSYLKAILSYPPHAATYSVDSVTSTGPVSHSVCSVSSMDHSGLVSSHVKWQLEAWYAWVWCKQIMTYLKKKVLELLGKALCRQEELLTYQRKRSELGMLMQLLFVPLEQETS